MKRRDFIRNTGWFVVGAALVPACGSDLLSEAAADETAGAVRRLFPQGVASGDPRPTSVVLWTRVVAASGDASVPVQLRVQVATDARCLNLVVDHAITATADSDHTVRVLVTGLVPATSYHYRFVAGADSITRSEEHTSELQS